ncbi:MULTISPECIES: DUF2986 domain-containing protein [Enterovibrio]|uniref:DUF2986 domain-containing protein n=1 Tax=Enterovibrio norvegicus FF-454 TaxID=1185651 RepID=A0A1E5C8M3_9GAMM|nr:DUF2986 domain-containing protein [Enterovibrio norvegicus]OEE61815.1 DUF2986 domain-containing protein [Enterovibrio norvegicus FF-454]OEE76691.1 DUF2986 domain-containing protein [Enterovibrio norvegicus FF-162]
MNRKKKMIQTLKKREKKKNAKLHTSNKPKYISKADREKLALETEVVVENTTASEQASTEENV